MTIFLPTSPAVIWSNRRSTFLIPFMLLHTTSTGLPSACIRLAITIPAVSRYGAKQYEYTNTSDREAAILLSYSETIDAPWSRVAYRLISSRLLSRYVRTKFDCADIFDVRNARL